MNENGYRLKNLNLLDWYKR